MIRLLKKRSSENDLADSAIFVFRRPLCLLTILFCIDYHTTFHL
ncbi:hypothetical protein HMPREF1051_2640 [Neisseria sicca VK64]|uniref:Uncharacterized protein n=1 Tax=Neisseria sicca VK64 TaxID=1095748 RepID=I2NHJ3_NEISI|nr:hypothetical protein HMPREF1051_2640 [Neisseria sicca VK64]